MSDCSCCARVALMLVVCGLNTFVAETVSAQIFDPFDPFADPSAPPAPPDDPFAEVRAQLAEPPRGRRVEVTEVDILASLDKPISLEFVETPLKDVTDFLRDASKINIEIDTRSLDDVGIGTDTPVTISFDNISLRSALRLVLRPLDLTYQVRDGTLLICTPEEAESEMATEVYPVAHLLRATDPLVDDPIGAEDGLIDVITSTIRPNTWEEVGGAGSLTFLRGKLIVSQTTVVHEEVEDLLLMLAEAHRIVSAGGTPKVVSLPQARVPAAEVKIHKALKQPIECHFIETPLKDVAAFLAKQAEINVLLDDRALEDVGLSGDTPVTRTIKHVSLGAALRLILREMDCTYIVRNEVLLITTPEECESEQSTRVFPVHDLVYAGDDHDFIVSQFYGPASADYDSLIDLITATVRPTTWEEVGGPGAIEPYEGCLIFAQTDEVFTEIEALLTGLRLLKAQYQAAPERVLTKSVVLDEVLVPNLAKLREALDREVGMLAFKEAPLADVVDALSDKHDVPILIDHRALEDVGLGSDSPITASLGGETLGTALRRILREMDLVWVIRDEVIMITSPEEAESELLTRVYPVRDLVLPKESPVLNYGFDGQADYDSLTDVLQTTVRPTSWEWVGGPGAVEPYYPVFGLVVSQTEDVHEEIDYLLAQLRKIDAEQEKPQPAADQAEEPAVSGPAKPEGEGAEVLKNKEGQRLYLKVYRLSKKDREDAVELAEVIRELVAPESWKSGKAYYLKPLAGAIIVRQTAEAHRQIDRLLAELDALAWPSFGGGLGGGGISGSTNGLQGGVFSVPDHIHGQFGGFATGSFGPATEPVPSYSWIPSLSQRGGDDQPPMPLAVYRLTNISDADAGREIAEAVRELIAVDEWQADSGAYLRAVDRHLIVRHTGKVHGRANRLLVELGAINPPGPTRYWGCGSIIPVVGEREGAGAHR